MKVILAIRSVSKWMGSERVFTQTAKWLERAGVKVAIWDANHDKALPKGDLVHWFNHGGAKPYFPKLWAEIKKRKLPLVATATYWPLTWEELTSGIKQLSLDPKEAIELVIARSELDRELASILGKAQLIIATSKLELRVVAGLLDYWHCRKPPFAIIPNVIDREELGEIVLPWEKRPPLVLEIGRIEASKNQINVLRAFTFVKEIIPEAQLVLVGRVHDLLRSSLEPFLERGLACAIGEVPFPLVRLLLVQARAHVLPSFRDTPGLASLEAAALGGNIIVSNIGTAKDYFEDLAYYVDPDDTPGIFRALVQALKKPPSPRLAELVRSRYTYEAIIPLLLQAYQLVLKGRLKCSRGE